MKYPALHFNQSLHWLRHCIVFSIAFIGITSTSTLCAQATAKGEQSAPVAVTMENFTRAETDRYFRTFISNSGINRLSHGRTLTAIDKQIVIRTNRDTLYSGAVVDLSKPVSVTLPETNGHYMSLHVIDEDHYTILVTTKPGKYQLTQEQIGTRYGMVLIRTFVINLS